MFKQSMFLYKRKKLGFTILDYSEGGVNNFYSSCHRTLKLVRGFGTLFDA